MKPNKHFKQWLKTKPAKLMFSWSRWLHIYISTALFSLLVFFCVSGITLNHASWASSSPATITELTLPNEIIDTISLQTEFPLKAIQQFVEQQTGLTDPKSIDVMLESEEITYDYPLPAGYVFVTVLLDSNTVEIEHKEGGLIALINDLHKGRYSGEVWRGLIDVSAVLILFFSLTGLFILLQNAKHRRHGFIVLLLGSITPVILYYAFVPQV
jgi:hypothetical protein